MKRRQKPNASGLRHDGSDGAVADESLDNQTPTELGFEELTGPNDEKLRFEEKERTAIADKYLSDAAARLELPGSRYDCFGGLIEFDRPVLMKIHNLVDAVVNNYEVDQDFLISVASALSVFLEKGDFETRLYQFASILGLSNKRGRKSPGVGYPIEQARVAKYVLDFISDGLTVDGAKAKVCQLLYPEDRNMSKERSIDRAYYLHRHWLRFVYAMRDEFNTDGLEVKEESLDESEPFSYADLDSMRNVYQDYVEELEKGMETRPKKY